MSTSIGLFVVFFIELQIKYLKAQFQVQLCFHYVYGFTLLHFDADSL